MRRRLSFSDVTLQACDTGAKGFLTASDLKTALDEILEEEDKIEVMKILGVLDSDEARVSLALFRQKVMDFYDVNREIETIVSQQNINLARNRVPDDRISPFNPKVISSPLWIREGSQPHWCPRMPADEVEVTFESNGEAEDLSPFSDQDEEFSFIRGSRLRKSFRGSRRFPRKISTSSSDIPSPIDMISDVFDADAVNFEFLNFDKNSKLDPEDIRAIKRQLQQKNEIIQRYEEELLNESNLVQSLEEKLSILETTNKEISHQLDNSKVNIKNLETHLIFIEEKNSNEAVEIERQRVKLVAERDKVNDERSKILLREFQLKETLEEFENWKSEILARNHILQTEILNLVTEKKKTAEDHGKLEKQLLDKITSLLVENKSLKQQSIITSNDHPSPISNSPKFKREKLCRGRKIPLQLKLNYILGVIMEEKLPKLYVNALLTFLLELICLLTN